MEKSVFKTVISFNEREFLELRVEYEGSGFGIRWLRYTGDWFIIL